MQTWGKCTKENGSRRYKKIDGRKMRRKIIVLLVTVICLAAFGAQLHSPPSFMDTITGATPRARKAAQEAAELEGSYVFAMNASAEGLENEAVRERLKNIVSGGTQTSNTENAAGETGVKFHIYVSRSDYALKKYARTLCKRLRQAGADVEIREYNNTMLRSRILSGRYQAFLASEDLLDVTALKQADAIVLDSEKMTAGSAAGYAAGRSASAFSILKMRRAEE